MNIANKLTVLRVLLVPVFIIFLMTDIVQQPLSRNIALVIFVVASLTDFLDGYLARSRNLVTTFGKFMDPLADKMLVTSALICFVQIGELPAWIVIIIVCRDFIISGIRLVAAADGTVIAASFWAKLKTATQMIMIIVVLFNSNIVLIQYLETILIYLALVLTIVSLVEYIIKNIKIFSGEI